VTHCGGATRLREAAPCESTLTSWNNRERRTEKNKNQK